MNMFGILIDHDEDGDNEKAAIEFLTKLGFAKELEAPNGCEHKFQRKTFKFCPTCGKPAKLKLEYHCVVDEISDQVRVKTGLDFEQMGDCDWCSQGHCEGWCLGVQLNQQDDGVSIQDTLKRIADAIPKLEKYFPGVTPKFL